MTRRTPLGWLTVFVILLLAFPSAYGARLATIPVSIILDSDMDTDCDDVAATALLHVLADNGEVKILATTLSSRNQWSVQCMDAINTYYGRGDLPVGVTSSGPSRSSRYTQAISDKCTHRLKSAADAEDAVQLIRRTLTGQPDRSVTLVTIGSHTNIAALLKLPDGPALVKTKVKAWVSMGGNFVGHPAKDDLKRGDWNFTADAPAAY